jgi:micrococcal nuclease
MGTVTHVSDGDTLTVSVSGRQETLRLIGVDTPETVHPTKPVQCWGPEASAHTKGLFPPGTKVFLARDAEARDKYGRFLAYVYRARDNLFLNMELVRGGWARPYPFEPNTSLSVDFATAANAAQQERLGLWAHCQG